MLNELPKQITEVTNHMRDNMRAKMKTFRSILGAAAIALLVPAVASADVIRFDQVEQGGTVTATGGGNFVGDDIIFEFITFEVGGTVQMTAFCGEEQLGPEGGTIGFDNNCLLNFDTAANTFTVTSTQDLQDGDGNIIPGTTGVLLDGTFTLFAGVNGQFFVASGIDSKDPDLLAFFGIDSNTNFTFANTEILTTGGVVTQADLVNTTVEAPEPGLLALFGLGLVGAGRLARRRRS